MADDTETKSERGRAAITNAAQRTTGAIQEGAGRMADAGHTSSDIARQMATTTAETVRHLGDTASETARAGSRQVAGVQQKFTENAARDFDQSVSRIAEVLQEMAPDWRALVQLPGVGGGKLQDLAVTMSSALERVMDVNLSAAEQWFRMSGPVAMLEVQHRFSQQYVQALLEGSTAVVRAVRQSAEQTLEPLEQRMSEREQQQRHNGGEHGTAERVADVMVRQVKLVSPDDNVRHGAQMMREADTGLLPVAEGDRLIGMLTDRDVAVRLVAEGRDPSQTKVRDVMTADVRYVFEDEEPGACGGEHGRTASPSDAGDEPAEAVGRRCLSRRRGKRTSVTSGRPSIGRNRPPRRPTYRRLEQQREIQMVDQGNLPKDVPASDRDRQREIAARMGGTGT